MLAFALIAVVDGELAALVIIADAPGLKTDFLNGLVGLVGVNRPSRHLDQRLAALAVVQIGARHLRLPHDAALFVDRQMRLTWEVGQG